MKTALAITLMLLCLIPVSAFGDWHGSGCYSKSCQQRHQNWIRTMQEAYARVRHNYVMYGYQQAAQRIGYGGTSNPLRPGMLNKVLYAPIQPVRNNPNQVQRVPSYAYPTGQTNLTPVWIRGVEYVLYQGRYIPVDNE